MNGSVVGEFLVLSAYTASRIGRRAGCCELWLSSISCFLVFGKTPSKKSTGANPIRSWQGNATS